MYERIFHNYLKKCIKYVLIYCRLFYQQDKEQNIPKAGPISSFEEKSIIF